MKIPKRILDRARKLRRNHEKQGIRAEKEAQAALRDIEELRKEIQIRRQELLGHAKVITRWIDDFMNTGGIYDINFATFWASLEIFGARFWQGKPVDWPTVWASVRLSHDGELVYTERYKRKSFVEKKIGSMPVKKKDFIYNFHPDFLKQWAEAIQNGKVWDFVERNLR